MKMVMSRPGGGQRAAAPQNDPATFNRTARLHFQQAGTITYGENLKNQNLQLAPVGYHKEIFLYHDINLASSEAGADGKFLSGHIGGTTNRFMCPTGLIQAMRYALNVASPVWHTDAWGAYLLRLAADRGRNYFTQVLTGDVGYARKERGLFAIYNVTDGTIAKPDDTVTASKNYRLRAAYNMPLAMGEAAAAGLVPVQDIRINPQVVLDFGARADIVSDVTEWLTAPAGSVKVYTDYFTVPDVNVKPDTDFVMQTVYDTRQIAGTGDQDYRPQIGGIILKMLCSLWNASKDIDPFTTLDYTRLIVQQSLNFENRGPEHSIAREARFNGKYLPNGVVLFDHSTGLGDPGFPSLRDRIQTNQLTDLRYQFGWAAGVAVSATAELRAYRQQLVATNAIRQ